MPFSETSTGSWLQYVDLSVQFSKYKLRIAIPKEYFERTWLTIYDLLQKASDEGIIAGMKVLNMSAQTESEIASYPERFSNNPFIIYLFEHIDIPRIRNLMQDIETYLISADVPGVNEEHLSPADLVISNRSHITFRQESLDGSYIAIHEAEPEELERLREEGLGSDVYKLLAAPVLDHHPKERADSTVLAFYNLNYKRLNLIKTSFSFETQYDNAQWLLSCELSYHPDEVSDVMKPIASQLMSFREAAEHILKNIEKKLSTIALLQPIPDLPQYSYELPEECTDPYYYINRARTSQIIVLNQYGENKTTIKKPWYEAFWLLFNARALRYRFDAAHFGYIFYKEPGSDFTFAQQWLLDKVLNPKEGVVFSQEEISEAISYHFEEVYDNQSEVKTQTFTELESLDNQLVSFCVGKYDYLSRLVRRYEDMGQTQHFHNKIPGAYDLIKKSEDEFREDLKTSGREYQDFLMKNIPINRYIALREVTGITDPVLEEIADQFFNEKTQAQSSVQMQNLATPSYLGLSQPSGGNAQQLNSPLRYKK